MEDLLNMSNKQLTELINQAEQIRKERLKQEKKECHQRLTKYCFKSGRVWHTFC